MLLGDRRKFAAALIVPDFAALERRLQGPRPPARRRATSWSTRADVLALYQEIVDALNRELSQFERIKRIALLPREFTIESGELTPTLKVKRKVVEERWRDEIEALYASRSSSSTPSDSGVRIGSRFEHCSDSVEHCTSRLAAARCG